MRVSPQGIAELASHEGIVPYPYLDSVGVWTLGIGHTFFDVFEEGGANIVRASELLELAIGKLRHLRARSGEQLILRHRHHRRSQADQTNRKHDDHDQHLDERKAALFAELVHCTLTRPDAVTVIVRCRAPDFRTKTAPPPMGGPKDAIRMDVVDAISELPRDASDRPRETVAIERVELATAQ
jgi:hypothetical protein